MKCKLEGGAEIKSGENATFKMDSVRPPSSADIVFLIEEARSLRDYNLFDSIRKLEAALRTEGIQHNRYAIIGYGGKGPLRKPHIRTSYNKVWSPATSLKIPERSRMDGTGNGDLYEAMEYAAQLGYRAGVSKTMIAVMSNKDGCENNHRYSDSLTMLIENDIRLHILTPEDFSMKVSFDFISLNDSFLQLSIWEILFLGREKATGRKKNFWCGRGRSFYGSSGKAWTNGE